MKIHIKDLKTVIFYFLLAIVIGAIWVSTGCRKDLGNYDYAVMDTLGIENIADTIKLEVGIVPNIVPELALKNGKQFNEDDYTYEWVTYNDRVASTVDRRRTIATTKNLDSLTGLGVGDYAAYYVVKQKSTGISWQKHFTIVVSGSIKKAGWLVLSEVNNNSQLDYFEENQETWANFPIIYRNLPSIIDDGAGSGGKLELKGKPYSLETFTNRDPINTAPKYWVYISTDQSTEKINITDGFTWDSEKYLFANEMLLGEPIVPSQLTASSSYASYAYAQGDMYSYYFTTQKFYSAPLNRISGGNLFNISPHFVVVISSGMHCVFFDTDNKRFVRTNSSSTTAAPINTPAQAFDMGNMGKELVWMGYTRVYGGQLVAVFKDTDNRYYLARITFTTSGTSASFTTISLEDITSALTNISTAEFFTMDQQYGYLFYTSGSKLYQYDMDNKVVKMVKDYGSRKISLLKVNRCFVTPGSPSFNSNLERWAPPNYAIIVATYDEAAPSTSGQVDFYNAPGLLGDLTMYYDSFTGMGKVADVKYSEQSN
ncbi:MAG: PKD-like family lipoprotein [Niabella sp.]